MKRTNLITVVTERLTDLSVKQNPYGWWVNLKTGKTIDISSDGGGGHHIGYLWLTDRRNGSKFGLNSFDLEVLSSQYNRGIDNIEIRDVQEKIYTNWFRVVYWDRESDIMPAGSTMITVADRSTTTYQAVMKFLVPFINDHLVTTLWVDTYDDDPIWAISSEDALFSKNFAPGVWYGSNESIDPQLVTNTFIERYGHTPYPEQAGWLTPDGRLIYMGRDDDEYADETSFVTHDETIESLSDLGDEYTDLSILELQHEGFIRCYGIHGIELAKRPTPKQLARLRAVIQQSRRANLVFFVDITDGHRVIDWYKFDPTSWTISSAIEQITRYPYPVE